ncbi:hypothetical protein Bbelb_380330 [Branchiostoma belcheri]|nr:hypothetical protein Bbelb_380330 [Branchiostoma belcheri]
MVRHLLAHGVIVGLGSGTFPTVIHNQPAVKTSDAALPGRSAGSKGPAGASSATAGLRRGWDVTIPAGDSTATRHRTAPSFLHAWPFPVLGGIRTHPQAHANSLPTPATACIRPAEYKHPAKIGVGQPAKIGVGQLNLAKIGQGPEDPVRRAGSGEAPSKDRRRTTQPGVSGGLTPDKGWTRPEDPDRCAGGGEAPGKDRRQLNLTGTRTSPPPRGHSDVLRGKKGGDTLPPGLSSGVRYTRIARSLNPSRSSPIKLADGLVVGVKCDISSSAGLSTPGR